MVGSIYGALNLSYFTTSLRKYQNGLAPWSDGGQVDSQLDYLDSVAEAARNLTWRPVPMRREAFNEYYLKVLESCRLGGKCAENNDKVVRVYLYTWYHKMG